MIPSNWNQEQYPDFLDYLNADPTAEEIATEVATMTEAEIEIAADAEFAEIEGFFPTGDEKFSRHNYSQLAKIDWYYNLSGSERAPRKMHAAAKKALVNGEVTEMPNQRAWELVIAQMRIEAGAR
jgi:hypothetical protein